MSMDNQSMDSSSEGGMMSEINVTPLVDVMSVSYTHLDVYKRQC